MPLSVETRKSGDVTIVDVKGRIVFGEECNTLRDQVKPVVSQGRTVVLNLRGADYIDSGGVGVLVALFTTAKNSGGELRLACGNDRVQHVLKITRLLPILGMHGDEASAIAACEKRTTV
jgi:anti-sigma B factor antagonist